MIIPLQQTTGIREAVEAIPGGDIGISATIMLLGMVLGVVVSRSPWSVGMGAGGGLIVGLALGVTSIVWGFMMLLTVGACGFLFLRFRS